MDRAPTLSRQASGAAPTFQRQMSGLPRQKSSSAKYGMKEAQVPNRTFDTVRNSKVQPGENNYERPGYMPLSPERFQTLRGLVDDVLKQKAPDLSNLELEFIDGYDQWCEAEKIVGNFKRFHRVWIRLKAGNFKEVERFAFMEFHYEINAQSGMKLNWSSVVRKHTASEFPSQFQSTSITKPQCCVIA